MIDSLRELVGLSSEFLAEARNQGLTWSDARLIEAAARTVSPDDPGLVLQSRELLERTALEAAVGDGGNLELSYRTVDRLARIFERLGMARSSDIPDPFRRVWVGTGGKDRTAGVALTVENGEIAVFCPAGAKGLSEGAALELSYRGFTSSVGLPLRLVDSCLFPGGLMLHLSRPGGQGGIGRGQPRYRVQLDGSVNRRHLSDRLPCQVLDMSLSGVRLECSQQYDPQEVLAMAVWLSHEDPEPFSFEARVAWSRSREDGAAEHGVEFIELGAQELHRLQAFLHERELDLDLGHDEEIVLVEGDED